MPIALCKWMQVGYYSNPQVASRQSVMLRRISALALGFLILLSFGSSLFAQGTSRLRVRVNVVDAVTATPVQPSKTTTQPSADAQLVWGARQQAHITTRTANAAELNKDWLNSVNPCVSKGTKVPRGPFDAGSCEITINTVEFVTQ